MSRFVLASASPRRREILENIGLTFDIVVSSADEGGVDRGIGPELLVKELAMLKASRTAKICQKDTYIIAADTIVVFEGEILEKPKDEADAERMLSMLSGKRHSVYTGVCIFKTPEAKAVCKCEKTDVVFRGLTPETIRKYIKTGEPMDKAGAYGIQGKGALLVKEIHGDYFNVVGLPVGLLGEMFREEFDITLLE